MIILDKHSKGALEGRKKSIAEKNSTFHWRGNRIPIAQGKGDKKRKEEKIVRKSLQSRRKRMKLKNDSVSRDLGGDNPTGRKKEESPKGVGFQRKNPCPRSFSSFFETRWKTKDQGKGQKKKERGGIREVKRRKKDSNNAFNEERRGASSSKEESIK